MHAGTVIDRPRAGEVEAGVRDNSAVSAEPAVRDKAGDITEPARASIDVVVACHFIEHKTGPEPEPEHVFAAVDAGLVVLDSPWTVTPPGKEILRSHGWL